MTAITVPLLAVLGTLLIQPSGGQDLIVDLLAKQRTPDKQFY